LHGPGKESPTRAVSIMPYWGQALRNEKKRVIPKTTASPVLTATSAVDPAGANTVQAAHLTTASTPTKLPRALAQGLGLPSLDATVVVLGSGP
jgi:hypothetical protein